MANVLLVMFNKNLALSVQTALAGDGNKVQRVVGMQRLYLDHCMAISADQKSLEFVECSTIDLAIVCTTSSKIGNYTAGEICAWLHTKRVACIAVTNHPNDELEMRLAGATFGVSSDQLPQALVSGDRSVYQALARKHLIEWSPMLEVSENPVQSIFYMMR